MSWTVVQSHHCIIAVGWLDQSYLNKHTLPGTEAAGRKFVYMFMSAHAFVHIANALVHPYVKAKERRDKMKKQELMHNGLSSARGRRLG